MAPRVLHVAELIYLPWSAGRKCGHSITLPWWYCRICGKRARFLAEKKSRVREMLSESSGGKSEGAVRSAYAESRTIPSLRILCWSVDRFIPRCDAAPLGPATIQLLCLRALRIC